jgi:hypothetical protein
MKNPNPIARARRIEMRRKQLGYAIPLVTGLMRWLLLVIGEGRRRYLPIRGGAQPTPPAIAFRRQVNDPSAGHLRR